jgi:hypothetical protein
VSARVRRAALRAERERLPDEPVREQLDVRGQGGRVRVPLPAWLRGQVLPEQDCLLQRQRQSLREWRQMPRSDHALHVRLSTGLQVGTLIGK